MPTSMVVALLLLLAAEPVDWSRSLPISIVATEYRFSAPTLTLRAGVPYRIRIENRGHELHEFTAPAFLRSVELGNPDVLNADRREVVLRPGEQKDLYLAPRVAGRYPFVCADHDWAGMTGEIVVESDG